MKLSSLPALACAWLFVFLASAATASGPVTIGKIYPSAANPVSISAVQGGTGVEPVTVQDTSGNYVQNTQVTFTVPGSGPSLTLDATSTQLKTNSLGQARFAGTANSIPGVYWVTASAGNVSTQIRVSNVNPYPASGACVVTSPLDDNSPGTLRAQVATCGYGGVITFAPGMSTVTLGGQDIPIIYSIAIDGALPGGGMATIDANSGSRIFTVTTGNCGYGCTTTGSLALRNLTLQNGLAAGGSGGYGSGAGGAGAGGVGGAVFVVAPGSLVASNVTFYRNTAQGGGGGSGGNTLIQGNVLSGGAGGLATGGDGSTNVIDISQTPPTLTPVSGQNGTDGSSGGASFGMGSSGVYKGGTGAPNNVFGGANNGPTAGGGGGLGGAIYASYGGGFYASVILNGVWFQYNLAKGGGGAFPGEGKGGALFVENGARVTDYGGTSGPEFVSNTATDEGKNECSPRLGVGAVDTNDICGIVTNSNSTVSATITTNPPGLSVTIDGKTYTAPQTFQWTPYSSHTLNAVSPQGGSPAYVFSSWSQGGAQSQILTLGSSTATFTANYAVATNINVTVTTIPSGQSINVDGQSYTAPQTFQWIATSSHTIGAPSPQGSGGTRYVFASWSQGGAQTQTVSPNAATTYTASFTTQYLLATAASLATSGTVTPASGGYYPAGSTVNLSASAVSGYTFQSWTGPVASANSASTTIAMTAPESVTANFVVTPRINVTVATNPPGQSISVDGQTYTAPQTFQWIQSSAHSIGAPSPQGSGGTRYVFASWSQGGAQTQTVSPGAATTFTANFTTQYLLTTAASPANSGAVTPASGGYYAAGSAVNLSASPASGFTFQSWTGPVTSANSTSTTITMSAPQTVTANFVALPIAIVVASNPPGQNISVDGQSYTAPHAFQWNPSSAHTIGAPSPQGSGGTRYVFASWSQGGGQTQIVSPSATTTYTANFTTEFLLTIAVSPANSGTVTPASGGYYAAGSSVNLSAIPASGYRFASWTGGPAYYGSGNSSLNMMAPETVTANFVKQEPVRINAGASVRYTDPAKNVWQPDTGYSGGVAYGTYSQISGTTAPTLYQTQRLSSGNLSGGASFQYQLPIANDSYTLNLKFADINPSLPGVNRFDVVVNGSPALVNFDPATLAGGLNTAVDVPIPVMVTDGQITIEFDPHPGSWAYINAIEIVPATGVTKIDQFAVSGTLIGVLSGGNLFVKNGALDAPWTLEASGVDSFAFSGQAIGVLTGGRLLVKPDPTSQWVVAGLNVDAFAIDSSGSTVNVAELSTGILSGGQVWAGQWFSSNLYIDTGNAFAPSKLGLANGLNGNNFIAALTSDGNLLFPGSYDWVTVAAGVTAFALDGWEGGRIGALGTMGNLMIGNLVSGGPPYASFTTELPSGVNAFAFSGPYIGALSGGALLINYEFNPGWVQVDSQVNSFALDSALPRIAALKGGDLFVREGSLTADPMLVVSGTIPLPFSM